jgi:hypothetical protein
VEDLGDSSASITMYYMAVDYTARESGTVSYSSVGDTARSVSSSTVLFVGDQDTTLTIAAEINFSCVL